MKTFKKSLWVSVLIIIMMAGCEDFLYIKPTNIISDEALKHDPSLVDAYLSKIYRSMRFQSIKWGRNFKWENSDRNEAYLGVVAGELNVFAAWQTSFQGAIHITDEKGAHYGIDYWPYEHIRSANEIIQILKEATFDASLARQKSAEARWLRAFMYFDLVKRYGGVPLITEPQFISQSREELYVTRNPEKEIYDFIASEMDEVVNILPDWYIESEFGRPTKWAAYALKSRAMLYAGSIAKYGSVQLDGLLGFPESEANTYFQKAYDAAMQIVENSPHELYREAYDLRGPATNFAYIFTRDMNSEVIFAEVYDLSLDKVHSWNYAGLPDDFAVAAGSNHNMYLEAFEKFEYIDGSSGKLDWDQLDGNTLFDLDSLVLNKDPRFLATAFYPEMPWQGGIVYLHSRTIGDIPEGSTWPSKGRSRDITGTGLLVQKRIDERRRSPGLGEDETDWIVFRTAEMYLNAAEASFEMGDVAEAARLINVVRNRSGMPDKTSLTMEDIRNERYVELYNEEHRYWDIRRWRIAVEELNGYSFHGVLWDYYIVEDKYALRIKDADFGEVRTFTQRNYYFPIKLNRLADNPNLVENPGY